MEQKYTITQGQLNTLAQLVKSATLITEYKCSEMTWDSYLDLIKKAKPSAVPTAEQSKALLSLLGQYTVVKEEKPKPTQYIGVYRKGGNVGQIWTQQENGGYTCPDHKDKVLSQFDIDSDVRNGFLKKLVDEADDFQKLKSELQETLRKASRDSMTPLGYERLKPTSQEKEAGIRFSEQCKRPKVRDTEGAANPIAKPEGWTREKYEAVKSALHAKKQQDEADKDFLRRLYGRT